MQSTQRVGHNGATFTFHFHLFKSPNTDMQSHSKVLGVRTSQPRNLDGTKSTHNNDQMIRYDRANGVCYIDLYAALYA